jgi:hypothetical protein
MSVDNIKRSDGELRWCDGRWYCLSLNVTSDPYWQSALNGAAVLSVAGELSLELVDED